MTAEESRPPELVIFDCDGVLVDSEPIANRILAAMLSELGLPTTLEESMRDYMGRTLEACRELAQARLQKLLPPDFESEFSRRMYAAFRRELAAVAGADAAVQQLRSLGIAVCVASSGSHEKMQVSLGHTELLRHFEGRIFSASEVARGKPHPDIFLHAAARMRVPASGCVVVEDSVLGVRAGCAAGMRVLGFAARGDGSELREAGARIFRDMSRLPELLLADRAAGRRTTR